MKKQIAENLFKRNSKSSNRFNTEPNYIPYNTETSKQNNYLSSQGTTGETKYIQTEKNISPKLIHKEKNNQKIKKTIENKIYDLNCTLNLNIKVIQDFFKSGQLPKLNNQQTKNLQNKIEIISKKIKERQQLKKEKEKWFGKKLVNNQIFQEAKNTKEENINIFKESYEEYIGFSKKKDITIRKCHKKFNEIQICIRRESQSFPKYKRIYGNFSIDNFILENENMLRLKEKLKSFIIEKNLSIPILINEIKDMKNNNSENKINTIKEISISKNFNNIYYKKDAINKLNIFLQIGEDILKNIENKNFQVEQIFNKISYQSYKNYYNNVLKYYNLINNDFSKNQINDNLVSGILPQNSNVDNNETNMSNLYFDIMNIGNNKSTFKNDDFSYFLNSKLGY